MAVAFFDLDRTLLSVNSATLWVRSEYRAGRLSKRTLARASGWLFLYHLGFTRRLDHLVRESIQSLEGLEEVVLRERTRAFYDSEIRARVRPGAFEAIQRHRSQSDRLMLLTTSSSYLSEQIVGDLGLDGYISNRFVVNDDGRFSGDPIEPLCIGPGKVRLARSYLAEIGLDLRDCSFYSDSASDVPMLEAVKTAVAVNPDPRLRKKAEARGWRIEDWGR